MKKFAVIIFLILFTASTSAVWIWTADRDSQMWGTAEGESGPEKCSWLLENYGEERADDYCVEASDVNSMEVSRTSIADMIFAARESGDFTDEERLAVADLIFCLNSGVDTIEQCTGKSHWHRSSTDTYPDLISVAVQNDIGNMRTRVKETVVEAADGGNEDLEDIEDRLRGLEPGDLQDSGDSEPEVLQPLDTYEGDGWTFVYEPPEDVSADRIDVKRPAYSLQSDPGEVTLNIDGRESVCGVAKWEKSFNVGSMKELHLGLKVKDERKYRDGNPLVGQEPQTVFISINGDRVYEKDLEPGESDEYSYLLNTIQTHEVVVGVEDTDYDGGIVGCDQYFRRTDLDVIVSEDGSPFASGGQEDSSGSDSTDGSDSGSDEVRWNGWTAHSSTLEGVSDSMKEVKGDGSALLDSGDTGYCGEAYFQKEFSVPGETADRLDIDYSVDADKWAEAFVSVDGEKLRSIDPDGSGDVEGSDSWDIYLGPGERTVRFGIRDTSSEHCDNTDHGIRLEVTDTSRTDTNFAG